ncbi:Retrovirus-related Pol polyprotein from transposon 17.6 [Vitis vinifera]|uniref:Retrovirus-related Pol polyprotein from transposon 17.6 n=1 Tax=Vitis vinifera TaxID=29760 RepID=A0A438HD93_VITVI|nr:Retrovirus-related Pol polyprotein from transposon 17.6 [Vitis vinifera]
MQEVVQTEVLKLLQAGIIYPILDNPWVSLTQVVSKNSGITVGVYSRYFQIEIDVEDQEKTTFTCPFRTYAYRRMLFGLCNAPATFQRCKDAKFVWDERCQRSFEQLKQFLTTALIDGKPYVIYYASKTLNEARMNYTTIEKELLAVVFALDKFRAYLVGSFIVVFTDHLALKYLLTKKDAKARLIRWILLLQEFNLQIKDKKGMENVVADHLSRLAIAHNSHVLPINDDFPEESLMLLENAP